MTILDIMSARRSIRKFKPAPLDKETMEKLTLAATLAPSGGNRQGWRFIFTSDRAMITAAAQAVERERRKLVEIMPEEWAVTFEEYSALFSSFATAPNLCVPLMRPISLADRLADRGVLGEDIENLAEVERTTALISVSLAVQNMLLAAEEMGLGACVMTGPLVARRRLEEIFGVPHGWSLAMLVALGHPDEKPESPGRKPAGANIIWR